MNGANHGLGLIERVEFHSRVLDHLVKYQNEMRAFFVRRLEEVQHDLRGPVPTPDFPPFEQWVEMQMKTAAAPAYEGSMPMAELNRRADRSASPDYMGRRD
ncbi:MAG TPA: hypothetical protein VGK73_32470 [Polyangiaceae bacterium]